MHKNRKRFLLLCALLAAAMTLTLACATMSLPENATPDEKREAMCLDARQGLAVGQIGLSVAGSAAETVYWQRWLTGAQQARDIYCLE